MSGTRTPNSPASVAWTFILQRLCGSRGPHRPTAIPVCLWGWVLDSWTSAWLRWHWVVHASQMLLLRNIRPSPQCFCLAKSLGERTFSVSFLVCFFCKTKGHEQLVQLNSLETHWVTREALVGKYHFNPTGTCCEYKLPNRSLNSVLREGAGGAWEVSASTAGWTKLWVELHCHVTQLLLCTSSPTAQALRAFYFTSLSLMLLSESLDKRQQIFQEPITSLLWFPLLSRGTAVNSHGDARWEGGVRKFVSWDALCHCASVLQTKTEQRDGRKLA